VSETGWATAVTLQPLVPRHADKEERNATGAGAFASLGASALEFAEHRGSVFAEPGCAKHVRPPEVRSASLWRHHAATLQSSSACHPFAKYRSK
jgi:DNA repair photolyase